MIASKTKKTFFSALLAMQVFLPLEFSKKMIYAQNVVQDFASTEDFTPSQKTLKKQNVQQRTLENGMQVFLLENPNDALIHVTFTVRAGFSSQNQQNCGFFKLFSRIIKSSNPQIDFLQAECLADSTIFSLEITPQQTEKIFEDLSHAMFSQKFSKETVQNELSKMKAEINANAGELSTLINAAIDSRVFSASPWKHDSGIYPSVFSKNTEKTARTILQDIADRFYTPQNSAIFITGNFSETKITELLEQTFGKYYSNTNPPQTKPLSVVNQKRKYVFHHKDISPELTQIVIQYTQMTQEECEILSAVLNDNFSSFKNKILSEPNLNIPGWEYIDVNAAQKKDVSRLIIQTLLLQNKTSEENNTSTSAQKNQKKDSQKVQKKSEKINSFEQTELFLQEFQTTANQFSKDEFYEAKKRLAENMENILKNPISFMEKLSQFWAVHPYSQSGENFFLADAMLYNQQKIEELDFEDVKNQMKAENPFVFVFINSKDFAEHKKEYQKAGFEEINEKNSSWYVQKMFDEAKKQYQIDSQKSSVNASLKSNGNSYFEQNFYLIKEKNLKNGIKVVSKKNQNEFGTVMALSIKGGKLNSAKDNGFEEVMATLVANLIQTELYKRRSANLILNDTTVSTKTDLNTSTIFIEFSSEDSAAVCDAVGNAIIFGEIPPAAADKAVSSRQYKKRLENGSASKQIKSEVIKALYGKNDFYNIFETQNEILQDTTYSYILQSYPAFLDASRYSIIICGDFDDSIFDFLENAFSLFSATDIKTNSCEDLPDFKKNKSIYVKINHTFLTDIPAEKAGPQPAVLVPTTEFLDPVIYAIKTPQKGTKMAAVFNSVLNSFKTDFQKNLSKNEKTSNCTVSVELPNSQMDFALITVMDVKYTKEVDSIYKSTRQEFLKELTSSNENGKNSIDFIEKIKNDWILSQMKETSTNKGTASLIQKGFEYFPKESNAGFYLEEYNFIQQATLTDFTQAAQMIPITPQLRAYSK